MFSSSNGLMEAQKEYIRYYSLYNNMPGDADVDYVDGMSYFLLGSEKMLNYHLKMAREGKQ